MALVLKVTALVILLVGVRVVTMMEAMPESPVSKNCTQIRVADPTKIPDKNGWVDAIWVYKCP